MKVSQKKTNILSLHSSAGFGGDETRLLNQCRLLNKDLFNVIVCTLHQENPVINHYEEADIRLIYVKFIRLKTTKIPKLIRFILSFSNAVIYLFAILKIVHRHKIDVLDCRLPRGGIFGVLVKKVMNIPIVTTLYHKQNDDTLYSRATRYLMRFSDTIICDSQFRTDELRKWIGFEKPRYLVIPSPIQLKFGFDKGVEKIEMSKLRSGKIIIAQVAKIIKFKGQDIVIEAFSKLALQYSTIELWIVGYPRDLSYLSSLKGQIESHQLNDRVRFISYPGHIGDIFNLIDIQVHASRYDSLPNSILEGMSVGKALIASTVGGIPEMVKDNETGLLFDIEYPEKLAVHMERLIIDKDVRLRIGRAARKRFDEHYSPALMTKKIEDAFLTLANKKR